MRMLQNLLLLSRKPCGQGATSAWSSPALSSRITMPFPRSGRSSGGFQRDASSSTAGSDFTPNAPPVTNGTPVFPDIDLQRPPYADAVLRNNDDQAVFVVSGASRGIGKQIVASLLERTQGKIIACCRNPDNASLPADTDRIHRLPLDLADPASIATLGSTLRETYRRVDMLWNVAGILGEGGKPERSLSQVTAEGCTATFAVNFLGPVLLTKELLPLVQQRHRQKKDHAAPPLIVANLSARVGSISDNDNLGGWYSYRTSKAALNQATRTMAHELTRYGGATAIALHPGTTDTDLSRPFHKNVKHGSLFPVEFTAEQLLDAVDTLDPKVHGGGFYDWAGKAIPF